MVNHVKNDKIKMKINCSEKDELSHGGSEKKIWYTIIFQKKYVEKGTTTPKNRKENLFYMTMYSRLPKNFFFKDFFLKFLFLVYSSFLFNMPRSIQFS